MDVQNCIPQWISQWKSFTWSTPEGEAAYILESRSTEIESRRLNALCQSNPGELYSTAVKNILKYLRNTKDMFLVYRGDLKRELRVLLDWKSAKQRHFRYFNPAEAEYMLPLMLLQILRSVMANESGITKGARHFRAKVHYLREVIEFGDIKLEKVHTDDNLADPFTKALAFPKHSELTRNIGMLPARVSCNLVFISHLDNWDCKDNFIF
ncbi:hypothetical protein Tco_0450425 [Tanacetum coccineum]